MKTTSRGKKPFLLSMISLIAVMLMIVGCGGGGGTGPVVPDTQQPIIREMKYEGEAGTDITSDSRAAAQGTLYVKASDNQTQSNQLTFDIKNGNGSFTSHTVTKGNDGYYVKEVAMTPQNIYGRGNFDGFDATARVRDATGNGTLEKRFFDLALSEQAGRQAITEAKDNVPISGFDTAGGFAEDQQVEIQGRNVSVDLVGHFTSGDSGWRELSVKYYNINDTEDTTFQNIVFNQGNVRIARYSYLGGNNRGYFVWLETNLDYNTSKDTLEAAFNFIKTDSGLAGNDVTITAQASPASGGDVRINSGTWGDSKSVTVNSGTQVTLQASAVSGYTFEGWYDGSVKVSSNTTYQVTATANKTYKANFTQNATQYTITAQASPVSGGDVRINSGTWGDDKSVTVNSGAQVTLEAAAASGYTFEGWYDGSVKVGSNTTYQVTAAANKTYKAEFLVLPTAIQFTDPILEAAVRNATGYTGQPTGPIYPSDVLGIVKLGVSLGVSRDRSGHPSRKDGDDPEYELRKKWLENPEVNRRGEAMEWLHGPNTAEEATTRYVGGLVSLEGIQYLTNLQELYFDNNQVTSLSPLQNLTNLESLSFDINPVTSLTPLQNLTNLQYLGFSNNQVSDLTPLQNLTNLDGLNFDNVQYNNPDINPVGYNNQVSDLTPLQNLTNLQSLYFSDNQVSDLSPLQNLTNLQYLWFSNNQVTSLTTLQNLTNLRVLGFGGNQITTLTPLQNLTNLHWLVFSNNQVTSLSPLQNLTNLESLSFDINPVTSLTPLQNLTNLQYLGFSNNQVSDLTPLQNLTNLEELSFDNNQVTSLTPLQNLTNLKWISFDNNQVTSLTPLQNLTNLYSLDFSNNQVTSLTPLQNLTNLESLSFDINPVTSLTPLQNLTNLEWLYFDNSQVTSLTPLQNLTNLKWLYFDNNQVSNISPLVANPGLGNGDYLYMRYNYLDLTPGSQNRQDIDTLISRGCTVYYDPQR